MLVRLIYPEGFENTLRLVPDFIKNIEFTTESVDEADLVVIVNYSPSDVKIKAKEAWLFHQEPANDRHFGHWKKTYKHMDKVFGTWEKLDTKNLVSTHPNVLWLLSKSYMDYKNLEIPKKTKDLSCVTSSKAFLKGHKERLEFLKIINEKLDFEIKGRGISAFSTKDEVLNESKYSIILENTREPHYFTEKISDALLCYNMPIYYGAPNIFDYFPEGSIINLESLNPDEAVDKIKKALEENLWEKNFSKIEEARNLVLEKYNLFSTIAEKIEECGIKEKTKKEIFIPENRQKKHPLISEIKNILRAKI